MLGRLGDTGQGLVRAHLTGTLTQRLSHLFETIGLVLVRLLEKLSLSMGLT